MIRIHHSYEGFFWIQRGAAGFWIQRGAEQLKRQSDHILIMTSHLKGGWRRLVVPLLW